MGVPKRRSSKARIRSRRGAHRIRMPDPIPCPQCGAARLSHRVCPSCGWYKGRQVRTVQAT